MPRKDEKSSALPAFTSIAAANGIQSFPATIVCGPSSRNASAPPPWMTASRRFVPDTSPREKRRSYFTRPQSRSLNSRARTGRGKSRRSRTAPAASFTATDRTSRSKTCPKAFVAASATVPASVSSAPSCHCGRRRSAPTTTRAPDAIVQEAATPPSAVGRKRAVPRTTGPSFLASGTK